MVTIGYQHSPREKIFEAVIDQVEVKRFRELSPRDIEHDNPEFRRHEEMKHFLEQIYGRRSPTTTRSPSSGSRRSSRTRPSSPSAGSASAAPRTSVTTRRPGSVRVVGRTAISAALRRGSRRARASPSRWMATASRLSGSPRSRAEGVGDERAHRAGVGGDDGERRRRPPRRSPASSGGRRRPAARSRAAAWSARTRSGRRRTRGPWRKRARSASQPGQLLERPALARVLAEHLGLLAHLAAGGHREVREARRSGARGRRRAARRAPRRSAARGRSARAARARRRAPRPASAAAASRACSRAAVGQPEVALVAGGLAVAQEPQLGHARPRPGIAAPELNAPATEQRRRDQRVRAARAEPAAHRSAASAGGGV